jgi:hypothetical protein
MANITGEFSPEQSLHILMYDSTPVNARASMVDLQGEGTRRATTFYPVEHSLRWDHDGENMRLFRSRRQGLTVPGSGWVATPYYIITIEPASRV